jgi:non-ribosomal peptide synthetase component F
MPPDWLAAAAGCLTPQDNVEQNKQQLEGYGVQQLNMVPSVVLDSAQPAQHIQATQVQLAHDP